MSRISRPFWIACSILLGSAALYSSQAWGEFSLLAGEFDGGEAKYPDCGQFNYGCSYQTVNFAVSADGHYEFSSLYTTWDWWDGDFPGLGLDVELYLFDENTDPLKHWEGGRFLGNSVEPLPVELKTDARYTLFISRVSHETNPESGVWTIVVNGAGEVQSPASHDIPALSTGEISADARVARGRCGARLENQNIPYQQVGPIRVSRSGKYYFGDARNVGASATCQAVYSAPINASNVSENLVANGSGRGYGGIRRPDLWQVDLAAGTDYWLVVQPEYDPTTGGKYFFVMAPPPALRINPAMTGLWADPDTPGQGMYLDVFNTIDKVFMAWFTYDLQRPGPEAHAVLGDPGHRWLTGLGSIVGSTSDIEAVWTAGGVFDSSSPQVSREVGGQVRLEFDSCTSGRAIYQISNSVHTGVVKLHRPFEDDLSVAQCNRYLQGPGIPGPL